MNNFLKRNKFKLFKENYVKIKNKMIVANEENLEMAARLNNLGFSIERLPYGMLNFF